MIHIQHSNGGLLIRPRTLSEFGFDISVQAGATANDATVADAIEQDAMIRTETATSSDPTYDITIINRTQNALFEPIVLEVVGAAGTITNGKVTRVADGTVTLYARHRWLTKAISLVMTRTGGAQIKTLLEYSTGTLAKAMYDGVISRATAGKTMPVYSTQDHATPTYVRSATCWAAGLDLTGVSPWNSDGQHYKAGAVVSPRHVICARHFPISNGSTIRFVASDNTVVTRTVQSSVNLAEPAPNLLQSDTQVLLLDSDLPASIKRYKVFPANFYNYVPHIEDYSIPFMIFDQEEKALTHQTTHHTFKNNVYLNFTRITAGTPAGDLSETIISGDSGNPAFAIVNSEPILFSLATSAGTGPAFHLLINEINAAMTSLGGGYQLTTVDLAAFPTY